MDFPRYVFTSPGKEKVKEGSYGTRLVQDDEEYEAALNAGFFSTMIEAIEGVKEVKKNETTRTELAEGAIIKPPIIEEQKKRGRPRSE